MPLTPLPPKIPALVDSQLASHTDQSDEGAGWKDCSTTDQIQFGHQITKNSLTKLQEKAKRYKREIQACQDGKGV